MEKKYLKKPSEKTKKQKNKRTKEQKNKRTKEQKNKMILRLANGSIVNVEKEDYINDTHFYQVLTDNILQKLYIYEIKTKNKTKTKVSLKKTKHIPLKKSKINNFQSDSFSNDVVNLPQPPLLVGSPSDLFQISIDI